ncbi:MAG: hypothetical protein AABX40_04620 [Candidatus Hydrothermarchaeota archaeon]
MDLLPALARAFEDYRRNLQFIIPHLIKYLISLVAVALLALGLIASIGPTLLTPEGLERLFLGQEIPFGAIFAIIFGLLAFVLLYALLDAAARGAVIAMARESSLTGITSLATGLMGARQFWLSIFAYNLFLTVAVFGIAIFALVPLFLGGYGAAFIALFFAMILMAVLYAFTFSTPQFLVITEGSLLEGMKGAVDFFRRRYHSILGYGAVAALLYTFLLTVLQASITLQGLEEWSAQIFQYVYWALMDLILAPYFEMVKTYMAVREATSPSAASSPPPPPGG